MVTRLLHQPEVGTLAHRSRTGRSCPHPHAFGSLSDIPSLNFGGNGCFTKQYWLCVFRGPIILS